VNSTTSRLNEGGGVDTQLASTGLSLVGGDCWVGIAFLKGNGRSEGDPSSWRGGREAGLTDGKGGRKHYKIQCVHLGWVTSRMILQLRVYEQAVNGDDRVGEKRSISDSIRGKFGGDKAIAVGKGIPIDERIQRRLCIVWISAGKALEMSQSLGKKMCIEKNAGDKELKAATKKLSGTLP